MGHNRKLGPFRLLTWDNAKPSNPAVRNSSSKHSTKATAAPQPPIASELPAAPSTPSGSGRRAHAGSGRLPSTLQR